MGYAEGTSVTTDMSIAEIKTTPQRFGASSFAHFESDALAVIAFEYQGWRIQFRLYLPSRSAGKFWRTPGRGLRRTDAQAFAAWEKECRRLWRSLALSIKAKLTSDQDKIETFEEAFLSHIVVPGQDGTVGDIMTPQLRTAYETGQLPALLPPAGREHA